MELKKAVNDSFIDGRGRVRRSDAHDETGAMAPLPVQRTRLQTARKVDTMVEQPSRYRDLAQPRVPRENETYRYKPTLFTRSCRVIKTIAPGFFEQAGSIARPRGSVVTKYCSVRAIAQPLTQSRPSHVIHVMVTLWYLVSRRIFYYLVLHSSKIIRMCV